jgi:formylglycine-generating enzyme required for sulfatase activity
MNLIFPNWFSKFSISCLQAACPAACGASSVLAFSAAAPSGDPIPPPSNSDSAPTPGGEPPRKKKGLPKWLLWVGLGLIAVCLISTVVAVVTGGGVWLFLKGENDAPEPAAVELETVEPEPITEADEPPPGTTAVNDTDNAEMVYVPSGEFPMGISDSELDWVMSQDWELSLERDNFADEQPQHMVSLDGFWIYTYEVTNAQFAEFLNAMGNQQEGGMPWYDLDSGTGQIDNNGSWMAQSGFADFPAIEVTWYGATAYCGWAGGHLPTEAQWEKAARGTEGLRFPWGDAKPDCNHANFGTCENGTVAVGSYPAGASPYGALDMSGNTAEWVADWYGETYYSSSPAQNPLGPTTEEYRVMRGGAWILYGWFQMTTSRTMSAPQESSIMTGFRCAVDAQ